MLSRRNEVQGVATSAVAFAPSSNGPNSAKQQLLEGSKTARTPINLRVTVKKTTCTQIGRPSR
jgi:hypothetical protein